MKHFLFCFFIAFGFLNSLSESSIAQSNSCSGAVDLTSSINGSCVSGSTDGSSTQSGEVTSPSCASSSFNETVWYKFTASATKMYVQTIVTGWASGTFCPSRFCVVVYNTNSCLPGSGNIISCKNVNSQGTNDLILENLLTGLTVNSTYLIQVAYNDNTGCKSPTYCISLGDNFSNPCVSCSDPCGAGCGFYSTPTTAQINACTAEYDQIPYSEGSEVDSFCYTITASSSTVSIQVANYGTCGGGVSSLNWTCQSSSCSGTVQSGTLSNMNITGLTVGGSYTVCINLTIPSDCYYVWYKPYFVGAVPLPIELTSFTAIPIDGKVALNWETASEINNDYFSVDRSVDGIHFESIARVQGAGMSETNRSYSSVDPNPVTGTSYYRLAQHDFDGSVSYSNTVAVDIPNNVPLVVVNSESNTIDIMSSVISQVKIFNLMGQTIWFGTGSTIKVPTDQWPTGEYFVLVKTGDFSNVTMLIKSSSLLSRSSNTEENQKILPPIPLIQNSASPETMSNIFRAQ